jgi:hypothetical protein
MFRWAYPPAPERFERSTGKRSTERIPMSEPRHDTAEDTADANAGRHRGPASPEDNDSQAHGRHRRPAAE